MGGAKTRLQSAIGERGATALYSAFVMDTLELCERVRDAGRVDVELWATSCDDPVVLEWGRRLGVVPRLQPDGDLSDRLSAAFDEGLSRYERVVIIGSDLPTLPLGLIMAAFDALADAPMALGPANDGGYYAIGATHLVRPRFEGVRWSTTTSLEDTVRANDDLEITMLPPWYDIDDPADLDILRAHLSASPKAAPATARVLAELRAAQR
jgi:rSAM/selenodomain-associated transferase 1